MADPRKQNTAGFSGGVQAQLASGVQFGGGQPKDTARRLSTQQVAARIEQHRMKAECWQRLAADALYPDQATVFARVAAKHRSAVLSLGGAL